MSFLFEQALRKKCEQNPDVSLLFAQWEYDRRLVADALQTIGRFFPHYSRHDVSHSNAILVQLARILGPSRIDRLSATDIWLLLETAYQHDIGMVVTDEQAGEWWKSPEFKPFLGELKQGSDADLRSAANLLESRTERGELIKPNPFEVSKALTVIVAEYARRQHARSAERIIREPGIIGLLSPRTPLIPQRLFNLLGTICAHHGRSFADTMRLPLVESGLGTEDSHPRFVACLLRLGDLLDLDNGRFCPVMMRSFEPLPATSRAHVQKHASVSHLQVDPQRIEVEAECLDYASYEATEQWFSWLREELKDQLAHWSDISPLPDFGALPSLGPIVARMKGYLAFNGQRPRFEVDRDSILKLVRGANIYEQPASCIRELLQNSVDATILRRWREHWSGMHPDSISTLTPARVRDELKSLQITVRFERVTAEKSINPNQTDKIQWRITIEDQGTGISLLDIKHIQKIGASSKNPDRQRDIHSMPEWLRPSGIFGIGLQSVFLFTDEVTLNTRHHETNDTLELTMRNGRDAGSDGLSIRRLEKRPEIRTTPGTTITFLVETERIPHVRFRSMEFPVRRTARHLNANRLVYNFDPITHDELPYAIESAREIAHQFSEACLCAINIDEKTAERPTIAPTERHFVFDDSTGIELAIEGTLSNHAKQETFYRGAPVESTIHPHLLNLWCNIYSGRADELLHLNRESFTASGKKTVSAKQLESIERALPGYLNELKRKDASKDKIQAVSLYFRIYASGGRSPPSEDWRDVPVRLNDKDEHTTLGALVEQRDLKVKTIYYDSKNEGPFVEMKDNVPTVRTEDSHWLFDFIRHAYPFVTYASGSRHHSQSFIFSRNDEGRGAIDDLGLEMLLADMVSSHYGNRLSMPCPARFPCLQYSRGSSLPYVVNEVDWIWPRMICPYVFTIENDRIKARIPDPIKLTDWIVRNAADKTVSRRDIARQLWDFIATTEKMIRQSSSIYTLQREFDLKKVRGDLGA